ncbi:MAG: hypothetical protein H6600_07385 [Flavobacteriales bacterium]|nr:hypothetical protein [Flavobacteriales bacterium]MCB9198264.1 hypothetical protein [Flavobacteriales bacterium]
MRFALILTFLTSLVIIMNAQNLKSPKIYGHRGCRGLLPENTISAFKKALEMDISGIEWDVVVSKDMELIISHEPYLDAGYCLDQNGNEISAKDGKAINFFQLTKSQIQQFDCGSKFVKGFPEQKKMFISKPSLKEAFDSLNFGNKEILFEIKSENKDYGKYQPEPKRFAEIISKEISNFNFKDQIIFMCFDNILLNELHKILPEYRYVYLTYKPFVSCKQFLSEINFTPFALGMYHHTIRKKDIMYLHNNSIDVFAWTVNNQKTCDKLKRYGIDAIITDYPDRIR